MARRNPFRGFTDLISETNRATENWMTGTNASSEDPKQGQATAWAPVTDIFTRGEDMVVRCDLAGVMREDLDITLSNGILTISGERRVPEDERDSSFYVSERNYGFFRRSMSLPEGVGEKDIEALFEEGVLEVAITGGAQLPSPRRIQIGGSGT
ncbi:Hsp20/alpha crystallin family protein [Rubrobacter aplysinae]|uniref:Hsp20/alpha crystallin family protein n=1 Tax=Rubrobacter aplysinae TaxID=909625 RepID=UPI00064BB2DE|nr:Hsp20/alpha crystallin family protein [Rubrobacter aplysinae]